MLTPPAISEETIAAEVRALYGLPVRRVTFLPLGADASAAVYRVEAADGTSYFLKLRRGEGDEVAVAVPAWLRASGIREVMAPLETIHHQLSTSEHEYTWILYPFFEGVDGYTAPLSDARWEAFGQSLRAIHDAIPPPEIQRLVPREDYSSPWRAMVREFDRDIESRTCDDPLAERFATFWRGRRREIRAMLARTERLGRALRERERPYVLCHTDLHPRNLLLGAEETLAIVDWDSPLYAPKERDLMCLGNGFGAGWDDPRAAVLFYAGYGATALDPLALAYYRYERILADLASYGAQLFGAEGSVEDRESGLRKMTGQFLPGAVVEIAHQTYQRQT